MYTTASDQMLQCEPLPRPLVMERRWNSNAELAPNCPRCASSNTKFCYYNNYSLSQPRYFCKGCRRYWTKGGSLRNVPVGGGCRKTRRAKAAASARSPQDGRVFSTTITSSQSLNPGLPTTDPSPAAPPSRPCGSDIDLAAVFAKFLNQSSSVGDSELVGSNQEADQDRLLDGLPPQVFGGGDQNDQIQQEEQIQELLGHDLQTVIVDELAQDLLWPESDATLPVFSWQPMVEVELQEFGSFSSHDDDQSKISANIISDNWSLFDLPACL